jgi:hypothetical protein
MNSVEMSSVLKTLEQDGVCIIESFLEKATLSKMQQTLTDCLRNINFNDTHGYHNYVYGLKILEDLMLLNSDFFDLGTHPFIIALMKKKVGEHVRLQECRGWLTHKTKPLMPANGFQHWHIDGWYDKTHHACAPPQYKVCVYLSDVTSGALCYIKGSHRPSRAKPNVLHQHFTQEEADKIGETLTAHAPAGSIVIFNTHGIHKQATPLLKDRLIAMYTYHGIDAKIDQSERQYSRYSPLKISAGFSNKSPSLEDLEILGFFDKKTDNEKAYTNHKPRLPLTTYLAAFISQYAVLYSVWINYFKGIKNKFLNRIIVKNQRAKKSNTNAPAKKKK